MAEGGNGNVDVRVDGLTRMTVKNDGTLAVNGALSIAGDLTESVNGMLNTPVNKTLTGPDVLTYLQASAASCAKSPKLDTVRNGPTLTGFNPRGATLLNDGRVFIAPSGTAATARIFDPIANTYTQPAASFNAPGDAFRTTVLLRDGRVMCIPFVNTTFANIFDVTTGTVSTVNYTFPALASGAYHGAVRMLDNRVFFVPHTAPNALIYDASNDTISTPNFTSLGRCFGGVLLSDGRVFCVPYDATRAQVYDPRTNTTTSTPPHSAPSGSFYGGVMMADGKVFCVPSNSTTARIFDPVSWTWSTPPGTYPGGFWGNGGALLPDGRIFMAPYSWATNARIYDPKSQTLSSPTNSTTGGGNRMGSILLPDGRVFHAGKLIHTGGWGSVKLPLSVLTSPFLNTP
jgi:hypothetical protein